MSSGQILEVIAVCEELQSRNDELLQSFPGFFHMFAFVGKQTKKMFDF